MQNNTKRYLPNEEKYGWYDKYNFYKVYQKHDPLYIKVCDQSDLLNFIYQDIDGAVPNPRMGIQSQYDYLNVRDIEGAAPKRIMGYTGVHPEIRRNNIENKSQGLTQNNGYESHYANTFNSGYTSPNQSISPQNSSRHQSTKFNPGVPARDVNSHAYRVLNEKPPNSKRMLQLQPANPNDNQISITEPQYNPEGRLRMDPTMMSQSQRFQTDKPSSNRKHVNFQDMQNNAPQSSQRQQMQQNHGPTLHQSFSPTKSDILAKSGSQTLLSGSQSFAQNSNGLLPSRKTIYDTYRVDTEYRETFNDPQNIYLHSQYGKPNYHVYKPYDQKPGMTRGLDFTPSTDQGQKYLDYLGRMNSDKASMSVGYAPAFQAISHLNNPGAHRTVQKDAPKFDVMSSSYKVSN
eukprot:403366343